MNKNHITHETPPLSPESEKIISEIVDHYHQSQSVLEAELSKPDTVESEIRNKLEQGKKVWENLGGDALDKATEHFAAVQQSDDPDEIRNQAKYELDRAKISFLTNMLNQGKENSPTGSADAPQTDESSPTSPVNNAAPNNASSEMKSNAVRRDQYVSPTPDTILSDNDDVMLQKLNIWAGHEALKAKGVTIPNNPSELPRYYRRQSVQDKTLEQSYKQYQLDRDETAKSIEELIRLIDEDAESIDLPARQTPVQEIGTTRPRRLARLSGFVIDNVKHSNASIKNHVESHRQYRQYAEKLRADRKALTRTSHAQNGNYREKMNKFTRANRITLGKKFRNGLINTGLVVQGLKSK